MASRSRRRSRIAAFQALFEADLGGARPEAVLDRELRASTLDPEARAFARSLVEGVERHRETIDETIRRHAPAFPLQDMSAVDRNVLRLAIYEMLFDTGRAPLRVAINEAVDIAKGYGSESSGRFVNGVLGAVAVEAAQGEISDRSGGDAGPPASGDETADD
jgi:N utilization substance protein B